MFGFAVLRPQLFQFGFEQDFAVGLGRGGGGQLVVFLAQLGDFFTLLFDLGLQPLEAHRSRSVLGDISA